jgi:prepilin-type N-terminal cleavage/methylation domain-containing protein
MLRKNKGFTLIELLVVIAIIGILSAVVLSSLGAVKTKGGDAAIQSDFNTIQTAAEIYYGNNSNSYGGSVALGTCPTTGSSMFASDPIIAKAIAQATTISTSNVLCYSSGITYAIQSPLDTPGKYWCVDSSGRASSAGTVMSGGATSCP